MAEGVTETNTTDVVTGMYLVLHYIYVLTSLSQPIGTTCALSMTRLTLLTTSL